MLVLTLLLPGLSESVFGTYDRMTSAPHPTLSR